jgi:phosphatidylinositol glycan class H protein
MRCHQPLLATHPELTLIERPGWVEYRIANSHLAWDGSGKVVKGYSGWSWVDALVSALLAVLWPKVGIYYASACMQLSPGADQ